jgi:hypothetical protein
MSTCMQVYAPIEMAFCMAVSLNLFLTRAIEDTYFGAYCLEG